MLTIEIVSDFVCPWCFIGTHRLLHWAQRRGDAEPLVERLFVGNFQRGENLGDTAVLTRIAEQCGYPGAEIAAHLASDADRETVLDEAPLLLSSNCSS